MKIGRSIRFAKRSRCRPAFGWHFLDDTCLSNGHEGLGSVSSTMSTIVDKNLLNLCRGEFLYQTDGTCWDREVLSIAYQGSVFGPRVEVLSFRYEV